MFSKLSRFIILICWKLKGSIAEIKQNVNDTMGYIHDHLHNMIVLVRENKHIIFSVFSSFNGMLHKTFLYAIIQKPHCNCKSSCQ